MLKKLLSLTIFILVACGSYLLFNTLTFKSKQIAYPPIESIGINDSAIYRLSQAIQIKTISTENPAEFDSTQFEQLSNFLTISYPLVANHLTKTTINSYSYLYKWAGLNPQLKPAILVAHSDVVPVPEEDLSEWNAAPFSGEIKDGVIWGRGTMDDKVSIIGILEAVEHLLEKGHTPQRTIYLAFGHDEEIGGKNGAMSIVQFMKDEGIQAEFVMDEGFAITRGLVPGVLTDVALIGTAEKGFASLTLSIELNGGHSSMPNSETAIKVIANAITNLENNPFPAKITAPVQQFLEYVGPEMRFQEKLVFANSGLFSSIIAGIYQQTGSGNAVVQTTMVPTVFNAGIKDNVIPSNASATINFRILPGSSIETVIARTKSIIDDDRIHISLKDFLSEPSRVSSTESEGYAIINRSIKEIYPDVITVPNLVIAATDGRYYEALCDNVYRFLPIHLNQDNITAMHGKNEHITVEEFEDAVRFYVQLIKNCNDKN